MIKWAFKTKDLAGILFVRISVGTIFLSEGIQKFLFAETLGVGRFEKIGLPIPHVLGPFVGSVEILFGALITIGLATRLSAVPLLIVISTAIVTTKFGILVDKDFWIMMHESRTDYSMFMCLIFLMIVGAGSCSLDSFLARRRSNQ